MRRLSCAGGPTNSRTTADTISSKSRLLTSSRRYSTRPARARIVVRCLRGTRRRDARRLASLLPVVRGPRRVPDALPLVARRQLQQSVDRSGARVDARMAIAKLRESIDHGAEREVLGPADVELLPRDGRR